MTYDNSEGTLVDCRPGRLTTTKQGLGEVPSFTIREREVKVENVITFLFILLDILSGVLSAIKTGQWDSTKMREGLFHKVGIILTVICAYLCDYGQNYINLGYEVPITETVLIYICFMELGSVAENILKINPELGNIFTKIKEVKK